MEPVIFLLLVIAIVLVFTFTNGFHDAANAIATVVGTKVLTPRQAVILGAVTNFIGALSGVAVDDPCAVALVNVPPATIQEPTWASEYTMPPSIFGVKLAGTELTT